MNCEQFEEKFRTEREIDANSEDEVLELTLGELNYVAGGNFQKIPYVSD